MPVGAPDQQHRLVAHDPKPGLHDTDKGAIRDTHTMDIDNPRRFSYGMGVTRVSERRVK